MLRLASWNVNGLRSCGRQGFLSWFERVSADVVCLQEIKVKPEQLSEELKNPLRYHALWNSAERPGYSGTMIYTKREPIDVHYGLGIKDIDREGRVLTAEFKNFIVINSYFPNSQRDHARLPFKLKFCAEFAKHVSREREKGKSLFLCADWNIAHTEIDLKNPKSNKNNAGFLPAEREWMTKFLNGGFVDTFRHFEPGPEHYTWWSNRPGVRQRNVGWRLDYFLADLDSQPRLKASRHQPEIFGSDHCPIHIEIRN